jgi:CHAD domain-containing protein
MLVESANSSDHEKTGLAYWMDRVAQECDRVSRDFAPEAVHDLRVALRRCRSIADGFMTMDPHRAWAEMRREGGRLFREFGELRDTQVMLQWIQRLSPCPEPASHILAHDLARREEQLKRNACEAVRDFNLKKWASWSRQLSKRSQRLTPEAPVFLHMALERWHQAHLLHRQALRNRSQIAFHRLRIGLKRFRYIVEIFLPSRHEQWGQDLRALQDLLGEVHDLDVLWRKAVESGAVREPETRSRWRLWIDDQRKQRIDLYRKKMLGRSSLWHVWRAGLPGPEELKEVALARLQTWASFRDPNVSHTEYVTRLALQLYDGLSNHGLIRSPEMMDPRSVLYAAALLHKVGLAITKKKHQKASFRQILNLSPPLGWTAKSLHQVALVVRYHRGGFPHSQHKGFAGLTGAQRQTITLLAGILRLATILDLNQGQRIRGLEVIKTESAVIILADGYAPNDPLGAKIARARYLLESACQLPVLFREASPIVSSQ